MSDETTPEPGMTQRFHCSLSTCDWYYETPAHMTRAELDHAAHAGDLDGIEAARDRLLITNTALRIHLETHTLIEWVTEVEHQRQRAEQAMNELAEERAQIGEARQEWGYGDRPDRVRASSSRKWAEHSAALNLVTVWTRMAGTWRPVADGDG